MINRSQDSAEGEGDWLKAADQHSVDHQSTFEMYTQDTEEVPLPPPPAEVYSEALSQITVPANRKDKDGLTKNTEETAKKKRSSMDRRDPNYCPKKFIPMACSTPKWQAPMLAIIEERLTQIVAKATIQKQLSVLSSNSTKICKDEAEVEEEVEGDVICGTKEAEVINILLSGDYEVTDKNNQMEFNEYVQSPTGQLTKEEEIEKDSPDIFGTQDSGQFQLVEVKEEPKEKNSIMGSLCALNFVNSPESNHQQNEEFNHGIKSEVVEESEEDEELFRGFTPTTEMKVNEVNYHGDTTEESFLETVINQIRTQEQNLYADTQKKFESSTDSSLHLQQFNVTNESSPKASSSKEVSTPELIPRVFVTSYSDTSDGNLLEAVCGGNSSNSAEYQKSLELRRTEILQAMECLIGKVLNSILKSGSINRSILSYLKEDTNR